VRQYVILGAGLDTFAYRQPPHLATLRIYEVDHPVTQQWKRDRLRAADVVVPANLTFVPIDFETTQILDALVANGFVPGTRTLCSWLGVTQYLTSAAIDATLRFALSLPRASEIVFSFSLPQETLSGAEAEAVALAAQRSAQVGEPWLTRFHVAELAFKLGAMGFSRIFHLTPEEAGRRYFAARSDGLKERRGEQLMRAIV
jgi:methyltransferase (TIGR00027 family)